MRRFPLVRAFPLLFAFTLLGCLADTDPIVEVRPRLVLPPNNVRFQATNFQQPNIGDMVVRWNRSLSDTQLNFKGYRIRLWNSDTVEASINGYDRVLSIRDSAHVYRINNRLDTTVTFHNIPAGRYTIVVWGEKSSDTLKWSDDSTKSSVNFDARPLENPKNLRATSSGPNAVTLKWDSSATYHYGTTAGYVIYYIDPDIKNDSGIKHATPVEATATSKTIVVPNFSTDNAPNKSALEHQYRFWIKTVRNDSAYFYSASDSNSITWAGAEHIGDGGAVQLDSLHPNGDSSYRGYHHALFFGPHNGHWDVVDDSISNDYQISISASSGNTVTLTAHNNALFLDGLNGARMDFASDLDLLFYYTPLADPTQFNSSLVSLPTTADSSVVLYLMFKDPAGPLAGKNEWARFLIKKQPNGTYLNASRGIEIEASFQPGVNLNGDAHLPYY